MVELLTGHLTDVKSTGDTIKLVPKLPNNYAHIESSLENYILIIWYCQKLDIVVTFPAIKDGMII